MPACNFTKSQKKYSDFLRSDCARSFAEYLGIELPEIEYRPECGWRFNRGHIYGTWEPTKSAAKSSYQAMLKKYRLNRYLGPNEWD